MGKHDWEEGSVQEFLDLSDADIVLVETKVALTREFRRKWKQSRISKNRIPSGCDLFLLKILMEV